MDLNNVDIDINDVNFNLQDETGKNRIVIAELINNEDRYTVIPIENQEIMEEIKKQVFKMING